MPEKPSPLLELRGIRKRFGGVVALDGVDFDLRAGEIHALLGENGAGKSTLIKVLGGIHAPDEGTLLFNGQPSTLREVADADRLGIRIIHQELSLAPNLSVAENLFLGREPTRWGLLNHAQLAAEAEEVKRRLELPELGDVSRKVAELSVAQRQLVEIARALSTQAKVLILDEPTASLSRLESETLFQRLLRLREQGVGMIYISHRLEEIERLADRITVLRDGRSIATQDRSRLDPAELIRWMVGRDLKDHYPRPPHRPGAVALRVEGLRTARVNGVSFELRFGEVLGFAGLVGAGRTELARALFGIDPVQAGRIEIDGQVVKMDCPSDALSAGIALVSEDRKQEGLVMTQTVSYNLALPWTHRWIQGANMNRERRREIVQRAIETFGIKTATPDHPIATLSGGNQQKVCVARWMEEPPKVLILDEPTRGVDVGAREEMFLVLHRLVASGMAVILISSDLTEVMSLSHRLILYRQGKILREAPSHQITAEEVMAELTRN